MMQALLIIIIIPLLLIPTTLAHAQVGQWTLYNETSHQSGQINMITANSQHIEFKDIHGNLIHLMKKP